MNPKKNTNIRKPRSGQDKAPVSKREKATPAKSVKGSAKAVTDKKEKLTVASGAAGDKTPGKKTRGSTRKVRAKVEPAVPPAATSSALRTSKRKVVSPKKTARKRTVEAKKPKAGTKAGRAGKLTGASLVPPKPGTRRVKSAGKLPAVKKIVKSRPAISEKEKKPPVRASSRKSGTDRGSPGRRGPGKRLESRQPIEEILSPELPQEYGENEFFLIPVEPRVVYASWEITGDSLPGGKGGLEVRFFEVTPGESGMSKTHAFLDILVSKRVGDAFFNVGIHGREIVAEIGHRGADGNFRPLLRSRRVLIPSLLEPDEFGTVSQSPEPSTYGSRPPDK